MSHQTVFKDTIPQIHENQRHSSNIAKRFHALARDLSPEKRVE